MKNCIKYYQTAEEIGANVLKEHCSHIISNHWVSLQQICGPSFDLIMLVKNGFSLWYESDLTNI